MSFDIKLNLLYFFFTSLYVILDQVCHAPFSILFSLTRHFTLYKSVQGKRGALFDDLVMYFNFCSFYLGRRVSSLDDFLI